MANEFKIKNGLIVTGTISSSGVISASGIFSPNSMTSPSGNITNLTSSNISASGNVSASTVAAATSMTSPSGFFTNLTSSNITASGYVSASTIRAVTSVTSPSGNFTNLTSSNISASGYVSASILTSDKLYNGSNVTSSGNYSHAEGSSSLASGIASHAEGYQTTASGQYSHAEGSSAIANGEGSHAEGYFTFANGQYSHAEGSSAIANGEGSHAEGAGSYASGSFSHAEGNSTKTTGESAHSEGYFTLAGGYCSHAEGQSTTASADYQHVSGKFNVTSSNTNDLFIIGNGTADISRSNILVVNTGGVIVGGYGSLTLAPDLFHNFGEGGQLSLCDSQSRVTYMIDEYKDTDKSESLLRISSEGHLETDGRVTLRQGSIALSVAIQNFDLASDSSTYWNYIQTPLYISSSRHIFTSDASNLGLGMMNVYRQNPITPSERLTVSGSISASGFIKASSFTSSLTSSVGYSGYFPDEFMVAVSDEVSNISSGSNKLQFIFPFTITGSTLTAYVHTAPVGSQITCSARIIGGSTISSSINASNKSGSGVATYYINKYQEVAIDINQVGSTTAGKGLKLIFEGMRKI